MLNRYSHFILGRQINGRYHSNFNKPMLVPPSTSVRQLMENFRRSLPTYSMREEILKAIRNHKVTMIVGGTGCGKTTQVIVFLTVKRFYAQSACSKCF